MGVRFYDDALVEKIKNWTKNVHNLKILKPEESTRFFEMTLDEVKDKALTLPLISVSRDKNIDILNMQKQAKTFEGYSILKKEDVVIPINVIPIRISYQVDIYTKTMLEADEYIRNFVFNFINYPKLQITLPYNDLEVKHDAMLYLDSTISDNSDIKEHLFSDQFIRFTLKLVLDDAYLFSIPIREPARLDEISIKQKIEPDAEYVKRSEG